MDTGALKVTWVTYQIIASTAFNLDISYPAPFSYLLGLFSFFSLDFLSLECLQVSACDLIDMAPLAAGRRAAPSL